MCLFTSVKQRIARRTRDDPAWRFERPATTLAIESLALPDESPAHLRAILQDFLDELRPAGRCQHELVEHLAIATIERQRTVQARTSLLAEKVRTAEFRFQQAEQAEVDSFVALLPREPARALAGLNQSAAGTRYQIGRWERLAAILEEEGHWSGQDRDEATLLQGAKPGLEHLAESETAYVIRLYGVIAQPGEMNSEHLNDLANPVVKPEPFREHDPDQWTTGGSRCRQLLADMAARALERLRPLEEWLRLNIEQPALVSAREQARVLRGKDLELLTAERHHDQVIHRAYRALNAPLQRRGRRRYSAGHAFSAAAPRSPSAGLITTPLPSNARSAAEVLDYHSAHREALAHAQRNEGSYDLSSIQ